MGGDPSVLPTPADPARCSNIEAPGRRYAEVVIVQRDAPRRRRSVDVAAIEALVREKPPRPEPVRYSQVRQALVDMLALVRRAAVEDLELIAEEAARFARSVEASGRDVRERHDVTQSPNGARPRASTTGRVDASEAADSRGIEAESTKDTYLSLDDCLRADGPAVADARRPRPRPRPRDRGLRRRFTADRASLGASEQWPSAPATASCSEAWQRLHPVDESAEVAR
jgi:hypothetical protein